ncbi:MAG: hypothetical protein AABY15_00065 [Nanoarchaeota archaeon]
MKHVDEFQKLFKLNFPVEKHHQYYIDTLMKSSFYAGLGKVISDFEKYESDIQKDGLYKDVKSYKLDYALPKLKNYILNTEAYKNLQSTNFGDSKLRTKDLLKLNDNTYLISIDFKSANYSALKTYDSKGELFGSWEELCTALDVHPVLASSKSFRQYVFGNTNPKRLQTTQHDFIVTIVDKLIEDHGFEESDFVFISHDEFVVKLRPDHKLAVNRIHLLNSAIGNIISNEGINMPTHYKVFKNEPIDGDMRIQTQYQVKMGGLSEKYQLLVKVPGNKFFKYFKTHILRESIDPRDLMFDSDGEIAVWAEGEDSVVERIVPDGEISLEQAKSDYSYLFNKIKNEVPGLNDAQIRKIINIVTDTCKSCMNADAGCQCWNDE